MCRAPPISLALSLVAQEANLELNLIRDLKSPSALHQVSSFLLATLDHSVSVVTKDAPDQAILDSVASGRNRPQIHLLPFLV